MGLKNEMRSLVLNNNILFKVFSALFSFLNKRSLGGFNDNPNVIQFQAAYRKLLGNDSIMMSQNGNCQAFDLSSNPFTDIHYISSRRDKISQISEADVEITVFEEVETLYQKLADLESSAHSDLTEGLKNHVIIHIANHIEAKIKNIETCENCLKVFQICEKVHETLLNSQLIQKPCMSTYNICKEGERFLKLEVLKGDININTILYSIINNITIEQMFVEADFAEHRDHKLYLIRAIIEGFIRIKATHLARSATQDLHSKILRFKLKKLIHFYGQ